MGGIGGLVEGEAEWWMGRDVDVEGGKEGEGLRVRVRIRIRVRAGTGLGLGLVSGGLRVGGK